MVGSWEISFPSTTQVQFDPYRTPATFYQIRSGGPSSWTKVFGKLGNEDKQWWDFRDPLDDIFASNDNVYRFISGYANERDVNFTREEFESTLNRIRSHATWRNEPSVAHLVGEGTNRSGGG